MRRVHLILRSMRRAATSGLVALWIAGLAAAALSHGGAGSQHLLSVAFALTLICFLLRFPRLFLGVVVVTVVASLAFFARPRRCRY